MLLLPSHSSFTGNNMQVIEVLIHGKTPEDLTLKKRISHGAYWEKGAAVSAWAMAVFCVHIWPPEYPVRQVAVLCSISTQAVGVNVWTKKPEEERWLGDWKCWELVAVKEGQGSTLQQSLHKSSQGKLLLQGLLTAWKWTCTEFWRF